ncbi:MAG: bifunctional phosphopantothenoylcysteine decarboxylase/phosphopantothenate--cysteine ligase CoaBC [Bacteroidetes bacterium]|nr:MAG: bifunctional phosphopantothenoylcysteine decarboxylase/phosphopantothenate--cysteine ligase CoaBC [Bacteroidota bacterium]
MLKGKKILLGVTGSIAAYKSILLVRLLVKEGAEVKVIMTPAAKDFVTPLSLSTISKNPVLVDLFEENTWSNHVILGRWADLMLIAPLSCNTLAKMANGICDNLLLATYLSATCPVAAAPAMDEDMWKHPATESNLDKWRGIGHHIIPVERGELASGLEGEGRMAEPEHILKFIEEHFFLKKDLAGKKALVTAGPTHESIDPVRFIGNHASGKMGVTIAEELARRGASVQLIMGPSKIEMPGLGIKVQMVESAEQMYRASVAAFPTSDIAVMAAAVADYTPAHVSEEKIKKSENSLVLELVKTKDILQSLGEIKKNGQVVVGFALENRNEKAHAMGKLKKKNADMIVLNSLNDTGAGFGYDTNKITIFEKDGTELAYEKKPKQQVAKDIVDRIVKMLYV